MAGTAPFPNESDKEIAEKVAGGLRPEWPANNPSQRLVDELREQIMACWNQEPNQRPTAPKILLVLDEVEQREPVASVEDSDDEVMMREWDGLEDRAFWGRLRRPKV